MNATRLKSGEISLSKSSHLLGIDASNTPNPSDVPTRAWQTRNEARADRVSNDRKYDWDRQCLALKRSGDRRRICEDHVGL